MFCFESKKTLYKKHEESTALWTGLCATTLSVKSGIEGHVRALRHFFAASGD